MSEKRIGPIPESFSSLEEAGEFWDTHDTMDYPDALVRDEQQDQGKPNRGPASMNTRLIESHPSIMMGKPVIAGTRITVESILEKLAAGESMEQLLDAHPRLTRQAIFAAIDFAAQALRADVVYPLPTSAPDKAAA